MVEHAVQLEVTADLVRRQAVELVAHRPPPEQVGGAALHLARARAAESEVEAAILEEPVHLVEQRRHLLDLVDHDLLAGRRRIRLELLPQELRASQIAAELLGLGRIGSPRGS